MTFPSLLFIRRLQFPKVISLRYFRWSRKFKLQWYSKQFIFSFNIKIGGIDFLVNFLLYFHPPLSLIAQPTLKNSKLHRIHCLYDSSIKIFIFKICDFRFVQLKSCQFNRVTAGLQTLMQFICGCIIPKSIIVCFSLFQWVCSVLLTLSKKLCSDDKKRFGD